MPLETLHLVSTSGPLRSLFSSSNFFPQASQGWPLCFAQPSVSCHPMEETLHGYST